jgi:hypothetical protein
MTTRRPGTWDMIAVVVIALGFIVATVVIFWRLFYP